MANQTTGELNEVKIGQLPGASNVLEGTLIPAEQQGKAVHITVLQLLNLLGGTGGGGGNTGGDSVNLDNIVTVLNGAELDLY